MATANGASGSAAKSTLETVRTLPRWAKALLALGTWRAAWMAVQAVKWLRQSGAIGLRKVDLLSRYTGLNKAWAVVTGGGKGIGLAFSEAMAKRGFDVLMVARDGAAMAVACQDIEARFGVKARFVVCDLSTTFLDDASARALLGEIERVTEGGDIAILCSIAGNSDLARHMTDHPLARNRSLLLLNALATLGIIQLLLPKLVHRSCKSAIITCGALTAFGGGTPGFATSSANKAYVRYLTQAISKEYEDDIDIMCAHPLAVESNIVKTAKRVHVAAKPEHFAEGVLNRLGQSPPIRGTYGMAWQDALASVLQWRAAWGDIEGFLSSSLGNVPRFAEILDRPIKLERIRDKLKLGAI